MTLDEIRQRLGDRRQTVALALNDVRGLCAADPKAVGWVDDHGDQRETEVTVYVLAGEVLYVITGTQDAVPDQSNLNDAAVTESAYSALPVSPEAAWSATIKQSATATGGGSTARRWSFRLGRDKDVVELAYEIGQPCWKGPDPTTFANALIAAIIRAQVSVRDRTGVDEDRSR
jgi:hypothetical protein